MAEINPVVGNCYLCGEPIRRLEFYAGSTKVVRHIDCPKPKETTEKSKLRGYAIDKGSPKCFE